MWDVLPLPPYSAGSPTTCRVSSLIVTEVLRLDADVLSGDVSPAKGVDVAAERTDRRVADAGVRVGPDEGLAAAEIEARSRALVRHCAGQPQHVVHRILFRRMGPDAHAAKGRSKGGVVDADERSEAGTLVNCHQQLLVVAGLHGVDHVHHVPPLRRLREQASRSTMFLSFHCSPKSTVVTNFVAGFQANLGDAYGRRHETSVGTDRLEVEAGRAAYRSRLFMNLSARKGEDEDRHNPPDQPAR